MMVEPTRTMPNGDRFYDGFRQNGAGFWRKSRRFDLNPFKSKVILQKFPEKPQKRTKTPKFLHAWSARAAVDRP
jgi:hypothetical protein